MHARARWWPRPPRPPRKPVEMPDAVPGPGEAEAAVVRRALVLAARSRSSSPGCGKHDRGARARPGRAAATRRSSARPSPDTRARGLRIASARIVVVTHGQASDPFWAIVKKGGDDAGRQTGIAVSYRAPDTDDLRGDEAARRAGASPTARTGSSSRCPTSKVLGAGDQGRPSARASRWSRSTRAATCTSGSACWRTSASRSTRRASPPASGWPRRACATPPASTTRRATPGWSRAARGFAAGLRQARRHVAGRHRRASRTSPATRRKLGRSSWRPATSTGS